MCRNKTIFVLIFYWWILIVHRSEVNAYELYYDVINTENSEVDIWHHRVSRVAIRDNVTAFHLDCQRPDVYICEEPPDTVSPDISKTCNYRSVEFHEQVYRWVAGRGCLLFTPDFLYTAGYNSVNLSASCYYGTLTAPCLELPKADGICGCFPFDPALEEVVEAVRNALIPSAHGRWERCYQAASDCCSQYMLGSDNSSYSADKCRTTFDGWTCWPAADAGVTASEVCSEFAYSNIGPACHHFSSKQCFSNRTWELQTDYSTCSIAPRLLRRYRFHISMLAFSIASCLPAVLIFFFYKRLRITRVALHRNLLTAIIVRNILVIISRSEIYIDELTNSGDTVLSMHTTACKVLSIAERIAANAVFICMLVEGIYLHRLIVAVFRQKLKVNWLYAIGAVLAVIPVGAWAWVMSIYDNHSCWLIYTKPNTQWILDAPRITILLINTVLFADVLRVLLTKIRNVENANQLNTAKATLFLMPIFGTQFLLTAFRPNTTNCLGEQIYYYVAYTVEGLQGFIVSMLYCYVNKEVRTLLKATYKKTETAVVSRVRGDSTYPRLSVDPRADRRLTYSTRLSQNNPEHQETSPVPHKLHVAEIISIQASERLADILEPVYETIENGIVNEGYINNPNESSSPDDSGLKINTDKVDNYYGFTNVSSVSLDCTDWIRGKSTPSNSTYHNSVNSDYDVIMSQPNHPKYKEYIETRRRLSRECAKQDSDSQCEENNCSNELDISNYRNNAEPNNDDEMDETVYDDCESMFHEIMQYIDTNETAVKLNADLLSPNRKYGDKIIFLDDFKI